MFPPFALLGGATYRTGHEPDTSPPKETMPPDFIRHKSVFYELLHEQPGGRLTYRSLDGRRINGMALFHSEALEWNRSRRSFLKAMCLDEKRVEKPDGKTLGMTEDEKSKELIFAPATDEIGRDRQVLDPFDVEDPNNWFSILSVRPVRAIKVLASVPMDEDFGDDAEIAAVAEAAENRNAVKPSASSEKPKKVQQPAPQALRKRTGTSHSLVPARQRGNTVLSGIRSVPFRSYRAAHSTRTFPRY
ncbi:MAG: hypothetical protein Q9215_004005 [Flavoplaca cf. flavocitrina]